MKHKIFILISILLLGLFLHGYAKSNKVNVKWFDNKKTVNYLIVSPLFSHLIPVIGQPITLLLSLGSLIYEVSTEKTIDESAMTKHTF